MQDVSNPTDVLNLSEGPQLSDTEVGVHIIYVPLALILAELRLDAAGAAPVGTVALSQVARHIGNALPTDIVVFDNQPWHFAGLPGHPRSLQAHPMAHQKFHDTVLVLSRNAEQKAVWWSETPFEDMKIRPSKHRPSQSERAVYPEAKTDPPESPFEKPLEVCVEPCSRGPLYVVRSGIPVLAAERHMFKISFTIDGHTIDPDAYCAP